jgi:zinc protease
VLYMMNCSTTALAGRDPSGAGCSTQSIWYKRRRLVTRWFRNNVSYQCAFKVSRKSPLTPLFKRGKQGNYERKLVSVMTCLTAVMTLTLWGSAAFSMDGHLTRFSLPNGLRVIVKEDHSRKVAAIQMWVQVGSAYEHDEQRGISHVIEHMAFKGTSKRGVGRIATEVEQIGGEINAYTSWDETVFHVVVPSSATERGLDIITDAVFRPIIDPAELEKEKKVVLEEILMDDDHPEDVASRLLFGTAYVKSPYRFPVIGRKEVVQKLTRDQILEFRKQWYVPENMFLLVVGDVDPSAVRKEVERLTADVEPMPFLQPSLPQEPPSRHIRGSLLRDRNAKDARLSLAFHIPSMKGNDVNALDLVADILAARDDSRLVRVLKQEKGLVNSIYAYSMTPKEPGLMILSASLNAKNLKAATQAIMEELTLLARTPPSAQELQEAKTHIEADHVYARETVQGVARNMGAYQNQVGDAEYEEKYLVLNAAVEPQQVSAVVQKYLMPPNVAISVLLPEGDAQGFRIDELEQIVVRFEPRTPAPASAMASPAERPVVKDLANGMKVVLVPDSSNPVLSLRIASLGGKRFETEETQGIMNFISRMLTKGTTDMNQEAIVAKVTNMGGALDGFSGYDSFGLYASFFSRYAEQGIELLADLYASSTFPQDKVERERDLILSQIKVEPETPTEYLLKVLNKTVFPSSPYGFDQLGTMQSISGLTADDLRHTYRRFAVPENTVICAVGMMNAGEVMKAIEKSFGNIPAGRFETPAVVPAAPIEKNRETVMHVPRVKAYLAIGFQGVSLYDADRFPLEVLDNILAGQGGRLFLQLRDKESLAYVVTSFFRPGVDRGVFGVYLGCDSPKADRAFDALKEQIELVRKTEVTNAELRKAVDNLIGNHFISLQSSAARAQAFGLYALYGLGYDYDPTYVSKIREVTAADVLRVARKYLDLEHCAVVKILPDADTKAAERAGERSSR